MFGFWRLINALRRRETDDDPALDIRPPKQIWTDFDPDAPQRAAERRHVASRIRERAAKVESGAADSLT